MVTRLLHDSSPPCPLALSSYESDTPQFFNIFLERLVFKLFVVLRGTWLRKFVLWVLKPFQRGQGGGGLLRKIWRGGHTQRPQNQFI